MKIDHYSPIVADSHDLFCIRSSSVWPIIMYKNNNDLFLGDNVNVTVSIALIFANSFLFVELW